MLQSIREHAQGWIAKVILGLIALTFAVWGVDWYFTGDARGKPAAQVNDAEISERDFSLALQQQQEALGIKSDQDARIKDLRQQVLEQLVSTKLLQDAAINAGLSVSDAQLKAVLAGLEPFQEKGAFSEARLDNWLRSRGMSKPQFISMLAQDVILRQVQFAYGEGALVPSQRAEMLGRLLGQQREVQELVFDQQRYINSVQVDDKAVAAHYEAHKQDYATPAQARLRYLVLSMDKLKAQVKVSEAEARQHFDANPGRYQEPEQRQASHILIRAEAGQAGARQKARAEAQRLLTEVRAAPQKFAELASKFSQDPVSAAQGGDLGSFTRDAMVKPFADAVFAMKVGDVSDLVETEFGFHIIRLTGITPGSRLGFDLVKSEIMDDMAGQAAQRQFAEAADRFSNMVYEQPDSLEPAAKEFNLTVQESGWISRKDAQPALLANERLLEAVFDAQALTGKQNTEAIEVAPNTLVAARVLEHRPAGQRPLSEVAAEIRLKLRAEAARKMAMDEGEAALKAARAGQAPAGMSAPMVVSRMKPLTMTPEGLKTVFAAAVGKLPQYAGGESREGYRLYRINRVITAQADPEQVKLIRRDLSRLTAQEELRAYMEDARAKAKITLNPSLVENKAE